MLNNNLKENLFNEEDVKKFEKLVTSSTANALASIGGMVMTEEEFSKELYKKFLETLKEKID